MSQEQKKVECRFASVTQVRPVASLPPHARDAVSRILDDAPGEGGERSTSAS